MVNKCKESENRDLFDNLGKHGKLRRGCYRRVN